ncbi:MAG: methyltransferase domain-containing protein [Methanomassiliicoccaceae archaeon]|jgi:tRNA (adenine57-N1/adenine58-N1)-methyltransferase|nr:methyltransferase domain-containing protein [Methanomassiliicoccaceae archaeon]
MPFEEGEYIFIADANDKRHWIKVSYGMLKIPSVGTIDGTRFKEMDDGGTMTIAGMTFTAFRPGTVDLIASLDRGAQIITPKDAASIIMNCDVKCGDVILEVGAGSGALTTALTKAVAPYGIVYTMEIKEEHALRTRKNLERTGLDKYWECRMGDARSVGIDIVADAVITDMPDPWLALDNLSKSLRPGGRICSYVPNMNQAESIVNALRERNFFGVRAVELLERGLEVHPGGVRPSFEMLGHTGYLVLGRKRA